MSRFACGHATNNPFFVKAVFCQNCYNALTDDQKRAHDELTRQVCTAPTGKFGFAQRQAEMKLEEFFGRGTV